MSILMVHDRQTDGQVALSEAVVAGEHTPARRYQQVGKFLPVAPPVNAHEHDLGQLKQLGYRLASANEQNTFAKQQKQATTLLETGKGDNK